MESLILAQNERWRRGLGMQVERAKWGNLLASGELVSNRWVMCLGVGNSHRKRWVIPHVAREPLGLRVKDFGRFESSPPPIS